MLLHALVVEYVKHLRVRGVAKSTMKSYSWRIRNLDDWLKRSGAIPSVVDFNLPVLERYMAHLVTEGNRPRTRAGAIDAFRNFGGWLVSRGYAPDNQADALEKPQFDAPEREHLTDEEVEDYLKACDLLPGARRAAMARAVVGILAFTIVRRSELLNLEIRDVILSSDKRALVVRHGKGEKSRMLPLVAEAAAGIMAWLKLRGECRHPYLFDIDGTRRLGDQGLRTLLKDVTACAGRRGATNFLPHNLRHNGADRMERNGAPLRDVQAMLGHARLTTTETYLRERGTHLHEIAESSLSFRRPAPLPATPDPIRPPAPPEPNGAWRRRIQTRR